MKTLGLFFLCLFSIHAAWALSPHEKAAFLAQFEPDKVTTYLEHYRHLAILEMERSGIPASIKMAQGLLESGIGQSELATKANNHFGIKCGGDWDGKTHYVWDDEPEKSCFRVFESVEACYIAHTAFLTNPKKEYRYGFLFKYERTQYREWAEGLQKAGYATSKTYAEKLIALIEKYELYKLDYLSSQQLALNEDQLRELFPEYYHVKVDTLPNVVVGRDTATLRYVDPFANSLDSQRLVLTRDIFKINNLAAVHLHPGDNLASLAKRYHISEKRLRTYNETEYRVLRPGQHLFLSKKAKAYDGQEAFHFLQQGQTLWDVAQLYGIRYKSLLKYNKRFKNKKTPAKVGDRVWLRKPNATLRLE